jgi:flavin-binding protein dodecin
MRVNGLWSRRTSSGLARPTGVKGGKMAESVYKVIELVGVSSESWEKAAAKAIEKAAESLRDLRIAEVVEMDLQIDDGKVAAYRTKIKVSFKYED